MGASDAGSGSTDAVAPKAVALSTRKRALGLWVERVCLETDAGVLVCDRPSCEESLRTGLRGAIGAARCRASLIPYVWAQITAEDRVEVTVVISVRTPVCAADDSLARESSSL